MNVYNCGNWTLTKNDWILANYLQYAHIFSTVHAFFYFLVIGSNYKKFSNLVRNFYPLVEHVSSNVYFLFFNSFQRRKTADLVTRYNDYTCSYTKVLDWDSWYNLFKHLNVAVFYDFINNKDAHDSFFKDSICYFCSFSKNFVNQTVLVRNCSTEHVEWWMNLTLEWSVDHFFFKREPGSLHHTSEEFVDHNRWVWNFFRNKHVIGTVCY